MNKYWNIYIETYIYLYIETAAQGSIFLSENNIYTLPTLWKLYLFPLSRHIVFQLPWWPFCLNSSLFCLYFTLYFPFSHFLSPFLLFLSPFLLFLLYFPPFSLRLFIFFPPNNIGWYFFPPGSIYIYILKTATSVCLRLTENNSLFSLVGKW